MLVLMPLKSAEMYTGTDVVCSVAELSCKVLKPAALEVTVTWASVVAAKLMFAGATVAMLVSEKDRLESGCGPPHRPSSGAR